MRRPASLALCLLLGAAVRADTIILTDGTFLEGEITLETSRTVRVKTHFGTRTYLRSEIEQVLETSDSLDPQAVNKFDGLPAPVKAVLNARAKYDLGRYEQALSRLEPVRRYEGNPAIRIRIDWLIIELNERLGRWETVRALLESKEESGTPQEKTRAEAHLAILDANPTYDLRYVGGKHARNFIRDPRLLAKARRPGALTDHLIMQLALEEYCEQLLAENELSVKAFGEKLDFEDTYEACRELPRAGDVSRHLPYLEELKHAESTLAEAQAILGDYGSAFEMDLVRMELHHLLPVFLRMFSEAMGRSPEMLAPAFDKRTGRLTKAGREQWRERCDDFLEAAEPIAQLLAYMVDRVDHYPWAFRNLRKALVDYQERLGQMVRDVRKARSRTHV